MSDFDADFERPEYEFEKHYGQFRNWWARDKRIVGNAFSLLMYLVSHDKAYKVSLAKARVDLELGKDAFLKARMRLQEAGFLEVIESRLPAGARDANGAPVGGHRRLRYRLLDPQPPAELAAKETPPKPWEEFPPRVSVVNGRPKADNPPRLSQPVDNSDDPRDTGAEASAGNPALGFPPIKENQVKENQSSSSSVNEASTVPPTFGVEDDDDDSGESPGGLCSAPHERGWSADAAAQLAAVHPGLELDELLARLRRTSVDPLVIDLVQAATFVVGAAPNALGNASAYVAGAIAREPGRWVRPELLPQAPVPVPAPELGCGAGVHSWHGRWDEVCRHCGEERPGWRDDRFSIEAAS